MDDENSAEESIFGEVVYSYSRQDAIRDGVLIDVSTLAAEAGCSIPVAISQGVYQLCVSVPEGVTWQDESGRLWDVLWMLTVAANKKRGPELEFSTLIQNSPGLLDTVRLKALINDGDDGKPVLTILLPNED